MAKNDGSAPFFDADEVMSIANDAILPRLVRVIFYGLRITNDKFHDKYHEFYRHIFGDNPEKISTKRSADKRALLDRKKLTFTMLHSALRALEYDTIGATVTIRHRVTGKQYTFSTTDTIEHLNEIIKKEDELDVSEGFY